MESFRAVSSLTLCVFVFPFRCSLNSAQAAWLSLVKAVEGSEDLQVIETDNNQYYLRAQGKSKVPPGGYDDLEFLLVPQESLVFFRTASRQMVFVYPVQQPLSDGGTLKKRLDGIQKTLGWETIESLYEY